MVVDSFEFDERPERGGWRGTGEGRLVLDLDGFEGPLDVLLALAREQKVDLVRISILQLVDQYIAFLERARQLRLDVAADYLVMAAWLAYLKSRLLLPEPEGEDELTGEALASALAFQLRRLEAMRDAGSKLMMRPLLGRDVLARGAPEGVPVIEDKRFEASLYDLLRAYADHKRRTSAGNLTVEPQRVHTMDQALQRLIAMLGGMAEWSVLANFLPPAVGDDVVQRSGVAATFAASLELARQGRVTLRQSESFAPIYIRAAGQEHPDGSRAGETS